MVTAFVSCGFDADNLKLKTVLKNFNNFGYTGNFIASPAKIRHICKRLRLHQKKARVLKTVHFDGEMFIPTEPIVVQESPSWCSVCLESKEAIVPMAAKCGHPICERCKKTMFLKCPFAT